MQEKNTLSIKNSYSDKLVSVESSVASYVDNVYYINQLGEDINNHSFITFPIKMTAVRVDWIFSEEGKKFL